MRLEANISKPTNALLKRQREEIESDAQKQRKRGIATFDRKKEVYTREIVTIGKSLGRQG